MELGKAIPLPFAMAAISFMICFTVLVNSVEFKTSPVVALNFAVTKPSAAIKINLLQISG